MPDEPRAPSPQSPVASEPLRSCALPERPKLRPVEAFPLEHQGEKVFALRDPFGFTDKMAVLPGPIFALATFMDGERSYVEIQAEWARRTGELIFREDIERVVRALDEALFLESDRFHAARARIIDEFRAAAVREPAHAGAAYPAEPGEIVRFIDGFYEGERLGAAAREDGGGRLVGVVAPHIDPRRGGPAYAHAYDAVERAGGADLYVIFGTAHQGALRYDGAPRRDPAEDLFIFTRKSFATPLGTAETDAAFVDRLEKRLGKRLDEAELSHRTEHSVEFQALFLLHAEARLARREGRAPRPVRIVPFICGSFHPWIERGRSPAETDAVAAQLDALRATIAEEEAAGRRVLSIAGADLAHIGLKFGDRAPVDAAARAACEEKDRALLEPVARADAEGFFGYLAAEGDRRNICGLPCMYAMLKVLGNGAAPRARGGKVLAYGQADEPAAGSMVSYCSVALYG